MQISRNKEHYTTQDRAYQKLISAIIALAIKDAQLKPVKREYRRKREPNDITLSALYFLFTNSSDGYLNLLDIDPQNFRKNLIEKMFDLDHKIKTFEPAKRRNFRYNYRWFVANYKSVDLTKMFGEEILDDVEDEDYKD